MKWLRDHPQCRRYAQFHLEAIAVIFAAVNGACSQPQESKAAQAPPPPKVTVAPVVQQDVPVMGEYVGQTQAVNTVEIRSQVTGFLKELAFQEGSVVEPGQLLFVIDARPYEAALSQAQAGLAQTQAALEKAQRDVSRYQPLFQKHAVSKEQLDTAVAAQEVAQANVNAAAAQVATAKLNVGFTRITAPVRGQIGPAQVKLGALVQSGSTLLDTIYTMNPMYVNFNVSENAYLQYARAFRGHVRSVPLHLVLAEGGAYPQTGRIDMVGPAVDAKTGTLMLRAVFPNPAALLKAGMFARVRMKINEINNALLVPKPAVQELQGTQSVEVVGPQNKVESRKIEVEGPYEDSVIVTSGLSAGDRVIVEGAEKVRPGMIVQPVAASQHPTTGPAQQQGTAEAR